MGSSTWGCLQQVLLQVSSNVGDFLRCSVDCLCGRCSVRVVGPTRKSVPQIQVEVPLMVVTFVAFDQESAASCRVTLGVRNPQVMNNIKRSVSLATPRAFAGAAIQVQVVAMQLSVFVPFLQMWN